MSSHLLVLKYNTKAICLLVFVCFNWKRNKKLRIQMLIVKIYQLLIYYDLLEYVFTKYPCLYIREKYILS